MATATYGKKGKVSRRSHNSGAGSEESQRLSHPGAKKQCDSVPAGRQYTSKYRKTTLGEAQYDAAPDPEFADHKGMFVFPY